MNNLPIPKTRNGWITALILASFVFILYYWVLYPTIKSIYLTQFYARTFTLFLCIPDNSNCQDVDIKTQLPQDILDSGPIWVYVSVDNKTQYTLSDVKIHLNTPNQQTELLLPKMFSENLFDQNLHIFEIYPQSGVIGRIQLLAQDGTELSDIKLEIDKVITSDGKVVNNTISRLYTVEPTGKILPLRKNQTKAI